MQASTPAAVNWQAGAVASEKTLRKIIDFLTRTALAASFRTPDRHY